MSAPFRITYQSLKKVANEPEANLQDYLGRMIKLIPAEVISLYLVGKGIIDKDQSLLIVLTIGCFIAVVLVRLYGTAERKENKPPQLLAVTIACVSYLVWVYSMGDVFAMLNLHNPKAGSLRVLGWSFVVPYFYKGDPAS